MSRKTMQTQTQLELKGNFDWNRPKILTSFLQGEEAELIYNSLEGNIRNGINYDYETKTIKGSTPFLAARVDTLVRPLGLRVTNLRDLSRSEVMSMVQGKYYTDSPTLVVRSLKDSYEKNLPLIKRISEEVEEANGKLDLPFMIYGFDVKPWEEDLEGYGIDILRREDFSVIHDERLSGKYNGEKFSEVDDLGLPLFDKDGKRTWYARDRGLSRLYLSRYLNVDSSDGHLANSYDNGLVVLVSAEGARENFKDVSAKIEADYQAKLNDLKERKERALETALEIMEGN